jgi:hypothetical protein
MIPLKSEPQGPMPYMEKNADNVLNVLRGKDWRYLQMLAPEQYSEQDFAKPGTLTFTPKISEDLPVYFSYGWCAADQATLQQNMQHIHVTLYFNGTELDKNVIHNLTFTSAENWPCVDFGVLLSEWTDGSYTLKAVATFDEKLNDGKADYDPGDYVFEYNVTVKIKKEGALAPSGINLSVDI